MSPNRMNKKVLITGAQGFTGRYMATEMRDAGYEVFGLTHGAHGAHPADSADPIAMFACDLCDRTGLMHVVETIRPDFVVHLAGIAFVAHGDAEAIYRTNVVGTRNLLESLASNAHKPQKVLLASSANVYGNTESDALDEKYPPAPANDYAVSKLAMEYMARLWMDKLPIIIARPFNYTGVGQSENFLIPKIVAHYARRAEVLELGDLDVWRDFSDVRNLVFYYRMLLEVGVAGETYNLCSGKAWSLREVLDAVAVIAGYTIPVRVNPAFVRASEVKQLIGSRVKLDALLGVSNSIDLSDTLRWMFSDAKLHIHS